MLVLTLLIMGVLCVPDRLLPTQPDGVWAPVLLIVLRVAQGFGIGESGEAPC
jgi:hypothetical protein